MPTITQSGRRNPKRNNSLFLCIGLCCVISGVPCVAQGDENRVTFDYAMVEKGIEWLEWIASGVPPDPGWLRSRPVHQNQPGIFADRCAAYPYLSSFFSFGIQNQDFHECVLRGPRLYCVAYALYFQGSIKTRYFPPWHPILFCIPFVG